MEFVYSSHLTHHGIMGQKWGKRNGPPYPLDSKDHSLSEKKAGWEKSLDKSSEKAYDSNNKKKPKKGRLSDKQKRAIKIGLVSSGIVLASIGLYYYNKRTTNSLAPAIDLGKTKIKSLLGLKCDITKLGKSYAEIDMKELSKINATQEGYSSNDHTVPRRQNCFGCTVSYLLNNLFGKKTIAKPYKDGLETVLSTYDSIFEDTKRINFEIPTKEDPGFGMKWWDKAIDKIDNGSTGTLHIKDYLHNADHAVVYEKSKKGLFSIVDPQQSAVLSGYLGLKKYLEISPFSVPIEALDFSSAKLKTGIEDVLSDYVEEIK